MLKKPFILLLFFLFAGSAQAASDPTYEVTVPVPDHGEESRNAALREGLARVFDRVSGQEGSAGDKALMPVLKSPTRFIDQFRYENAPEGLRIWMKFEPNAVNETLRERGRSVSEAPRAASLPVTLAWLIVRQGNQIHVVGATDGAPEAAALESVARDRGMTIHLPLMDLEESRRVRADEVWSGADERLFELAERYDVGSVLVGRIEAVTPNQWRVRWSARVGSETQTWEGGGASLRELLASGVDQIVGLVNRRFAPAQPSRPAVQSGGTAPSATGALMLRVADVAGFNDFNRVRDYLRTLPGIGRVDTVTVEPNALTLRVTMDADPARVLDLITNGRTLERLPGQPAPGGTGTLEFRLLP